MTKRTLQRGRSSLDPQPTPSTDVAPDIAHDVEPDFVPPTPLPTAGTIASDLRTAVLDVEHLERTLDAARLAFINRPEFQTALSDELRSRIWDEKFPEFRETEDTILKEVKAIQRTIGRQFQSIEALNRIETYPDGAVDQAAQLAPFVTAEAAEMSGARLTEHLTAITARNVPHEILAWRMAARTWLTTHAQDRAAGDVRGLVGRMGATFRQQDNARSLRDRLERAQQTAAALARRIETARRHRGEIPDFLHGALPNRTRSDGDRITGYERS